MGEPLAPAAAEFEPSKDRMGGPLAPAASAERKLRAPAVGDPPAPPAASSAEYELDCPICMQPFLEPMTTSCGHDFCAHCLKRALGPQDLYADDHPQECPLCRGLVGVPQSNAGLALRVTTRFGPDYAERRRHDTDVPQPPPAALALAVDEPRDEEREAIVDAVRKQGGYRTLALNASLDLSGGGWEALPKCLHEFAGLRQLRVEHNLLRSLGGLQLPGLLALSASHNQIQSLGGSLACASQLVRLDLANNLLTHVDGLPPSLQSLYLAGNRLASASAAAGLAGCVALDVLDLARNALPLGALGAMGEQLRARVRCLYLTGNPLVEELSAARGSYRKALICEFSKLSYLDDFPVEASERRAADAWSRGGEAGEKAERERQQQERTDRVRRNTAFMMEKKRLAQERRAAAELAAAGQGGGAGAAAGGAGGALAVEAASSWSVAGVLAAAALATAARQAGASGDERGGGAQPPPTPSTTPAVRATAAVRTASAAAGAGAVGGVPSRAAAAAAAEARLEPAASSSQPRAHARAESEPLEAATAALGPPAAAANN